MKIAFIGALAALFLSLGQGTSTVTPTTPMTIGESIDPSTGFLLPDPVPAGQCRAPQTSKLPPIPEDAPKNSSYLSTMVPPIRYQNDMSIKIQFVSINEANRVCAGGSAPVCGQRFFACFDGNKLIMPNPCKYPSSDPYARILCHEIAHVNNWPAYHGD